MSDEPKFKEDMSLSETAEYRDPEHELTRKDYSVLLAALDSYMHSLMRVVMQDQNDIKLRSSASYSIRLAMETHMHLAEHSGYFSPDELEKYKEKLEHCEKMVAMADQLIEKLSSRQEGPKDPTEWN